VSRRKASQISRSLRLLRCRFLRTRRRPPSSSASRAVTEKRECPLGVVDGERNDMHAAP